MSESRFMLYRSNAVKEMLVWGLGVATILGLAGACRNPDDYKQSADKEVYEVLTDKWQDDFGRQVNY